MTLSLNSSVSIFFISHFISSSSAKASFCHFPPSSVKVCPSSIFIMSHALSPSLKIALPSLIVFDAFFSLPSTASSLFRYSCNFTYSLLSSAVLSSCFLFLSSDFFSFSLSFSFSFSSFSLFSNIQHNSFLTFLLL